MNDRRQAMVHLIEELARNRESTSMAEMTDAAHRCGLAEDRSETTLRMLLNLAIRDFRRTLTNEVFVHAHGRYRLADNPVDAENWRRKRCVTVMKQIENIGEYAEAEANRFGHGQAPDEAWSMAHESLQRARRDVERASRLTFG